MTTVDDAGAGAGVPAVPRQSLVGAVLWAIGVLLFISLLAIAARETSRDIPTSHLMFWRSLGAFLVLMVIAFVRGLGRGDLMPRRPLPHLWRATSHFAAQYCWFVALTMIPLAQVFALEFTYPLLMVLLAPLMLGERLTPLRLASVVIGFAGVIVVLRPTGLALGLGTLAALLCAVGYAFSSMAMKDLTRTETAFSILLSMAIIQAALALGPMLATFKWPAPVTWAWIAAAACFGLLAQYCMARAYALADAVVVAPLDFFRLPLIAVVGLAVYSEPLDPWVLGGGAVIVVANLVNLLGARR